MELRWLRFPDGVVSFPQARHNMVVSYLAEHLVYMCLVSTEMGREME